MTLLILFLSIALALVLATPLLLTLAPWQIRRPRLALWLWFSSFALGVIALTLAMVTAVYLGLVAETVEPEWLSILTTVTAWLALAVLGALITLVVTTSQPIIESQYRYHEQIQPNIVSTTQRSHLKIHLFADQELLAYTLSGSNPQIFISTGIKEVLSEKQLLAVLAHEYAHLELHHHWAIRVAEVNARCLPFMRAGQQLKRATFLLIELIADDRSAKQVGPAQLANALARLATLTNDLSMEMRAQRLAQRSWPLSQRRRIPDAIRFPNNSALFESE